jgi:hypothetical protein
LQVDNRPCPDCDGTGNVPQHGGLRQKNCWRCGAEAGCRRNPTLNKYFPNLQPKCGLCNFANCGIAFWYCVRSVPPTSSPSRWPGSSSALVAGPSAHEVDPMVPDEVEQAMPIIWTTDEPIEEVTRRLADLNRKLAKLQRSRSRTSTSVKLDRDRARVELLELIELAEIGT